MAVQFQVMKSTRRKRADLCVLSHHVKQISKYVHVSYVGSVRFEPIS